MKSPILQRYVAHFRAFSRMLQLGVVAMLAGCSSFGASGPSAGAVLSSDGRNAAGSEIQIVELNNDVARQVLAADRGMLLSELIGSDTPTERVVGRGDTLEVSIWEAPPAVLFGTTLSAARAISMDSATRVSTLPEVLINNDGTISLPFIGSMPVAGRTTNEIEHEIVARLDGLAHSPQAMVRLIRNAADTVTVVGDVSSSIRFPLTPKGERLLDALAAAGGVKQPVNKITIQLTRGMIVATQALDTIIRDPAQNIVLQPNDVVTAMYQPYSFTSLGAVINNAEIPFESTGITLAQGLGRMGGLRDERADIRGVFIFRLEKPGTLGGIIPEGARTTPDGKVPVIYRLDLKDPVSFFVAQGFPIQNRDVVYVSNAPIADLQKFVNIVTSMTFSIVGIKNSL